MNVVGSAVEGNNIVKDFSDVFPEDLLGLPPDKEVEFGIVVFSGIAPVFIAPYHMATNKLKELKLLL